MIRCHLQAIGIFSVLASGCSAEEPERLSLLPTLNELEPVFLCVDSASPSQEVEACVGSKQLPDIKGAEYPRDLNDFRDNLIGGTALLRLLGGSKSGLTSEMYRRAVGYAKCVEEAAYAQGGAAENTQKAYIWAGVRAHSKCQDEPSSPSRLAESEANPSTAAIESSLAQTLGSAAFDYVYEANGWITDEMRPCVTYGYKSEVSPGCKTVNGRVPVAPPPSMPTQND